jgi:hypothetical protein
LFKKIVSKSNSALDSGRLQNAVGCHDKQGATKYFHNCFAIELMTILGDLSVRPASERWGSRAGASLSKTAQPDFNDFSSRFPARAPLPLQQMIRFVLSPCVMTRMLKFSAESMRKMAPAPRWRAAQSLLTNNLLKGRHVGMAQTEGAAIHPRHDRRTYQAQ